jgi:RHS repeat-associated protein
LNAYDYRHRRFRKETQTAVHFYVWDGWNLAAETVSNKLTSAVYADLYTWGTDLSGTLQGAGGVGGLLAVTRVSASSVQTFFPCYDANGNVTEYVDASGTVRARYEYSPFGEIISRSGDLADTFTHRFSTKPYDAETSFVVFQQRTYISAFGCWASRDPLDERGGLNLHGILDNKTINLYDFLGLLATVTAITDITDKDDWKIWELFFGLVPVSSGEIRIMATVSSPDDFINLLLTTYVLHGEISRVNLSGHGLAGGTGALASTKSIDLSRFTEQQKTTIQKVLAPNAEIFVYSCNAASGVRYFTSQSAADDLQTCIHAKDGLCAAGPDMGQYWNPSSNKIVAYFERLSSGWTRFTPQAKPKCAKTDSSVEIKFITEGN